MFSLIITIVSIALVAALVLATLYYGGAAFNKGTVSASATKAIAQGQQIQGAMDLYRADFGSWPTKEQLLGANDRGFIYLRSWPTSTKLPLVATSKVVAPALAQAVQTDGATTVPGVEWKVPTNPTQPTAVLSESVTEEVCANINLKSRGDDGIARVLSTSYATQCYSPADGTFVVVVTKAPYADLVTGLTDGGGTPPTIIVTPLNVNTPTDPVWVKPPGVVAPPPGSGTGTASAWSLTSAAQGNGVAPLSILQQGEVATVSILPESGPPTVVKLTNTGSQNIQLSVPDGLIENPVVVAVFNKFWVDRVLGGVSSAYTLYANSPVCESDRLLTPGTSCSLFLSTRGFACAAADSPLINLGAGINIRPLACPVAPTPAPRLEFRGLAAPNPYPDSFVFSRYSDSSSNGYSTDQNRTMTATFVSSGNVPVVIQSVSVDGPFVAQSGFTSDCTPGQAVAEGTFCVVRYVLPSSVFEDVLQQGTLRVTTEDGTVLETPVQATLVSEPWRRVEASPAGFYQATGYLNSVPLPVNGAVLKGSDGGQRLRVSSGMPGVLSADLSVGIDNPDFEVRASDSSDTCAAVSYSLTGGTSCEFVVSLTPAARSSLGLHVANVTVASPYGTSTVTVQVFIVDTTPAIVDLETRIIQEFQAAVQAGAGMTASLQSLLGQMVTEIRKQWPAP